MAVVSCCSVGFDVRQELGMPDYMAAVGDGGSIDLQTIAR